MRRTLITILVLLATVVAAIAQVEIYSTGHAGTPDDPIPANQRASFSARIDGVEAEKTSGYGFQWRSNPQLHAFGSDIATVSFGIPDWNQPRTLEVILHLGGGRHSGTYRKAFHVAPNEREEIERTVEVRFSKGEPARAQVRESAFEAARAVGKVRKVGLFFPEWRFDGSFEEFRKLFLFPADPETGPIGLPSNGEEEPEPEEPADPEEPEEPAGSRRKAIELLKEVIELLEEEQDG